MSWTFDFVISIRLSYTFQAHTHEQINMFDGAVHTLRQALLRSEC